MPTSEAMSVRAAVHRAFNRIGHANSHACPAGGSNFEPDLHELFVASELESVSKKRRQDALSVVRKRVIEVEGRDAIAEVEEGTEQVILSSEHYDLLTKVANASSRLNKARLQSKLIIDFGISLDQANKFLEACSVTSKAATTVRSVGK